MIMINLGIHLIPPHDMHRLEFDEADNTNVTGVHVFDDFAERISCIAQDANGFLYAANKYGNLYVSVKNHYWFCTCA